MYNAHLYILNEYVLYINIPNNRIQNIINIYTNIHIIRKRGKPIEGG
jgi:hypothetical protein